MTKKTNPCSGCSRRAILQGLGVTAIGTLLIGTAAGCQSAAPPTATTSTCGTGGICVSLSDPANAPLMKSGGAMIVDSANDSILVIRVSDTEVAAVSAVCTHAGCIVDFDQQVKLVSCPCHGSQFGEDGHVIRGPARTPLRSYTATLTNEMITIAA
jgi:cytochrome b6-f complex iron-sulfur subunit